MDPKSIRIIFLGTPDFAACSLEKLITEGYNVVAVVTASDKPAGRGKQVQQSAVKMLAASRNIPVLQPEKLKSPEFLEALKSYRPDLMIVVAFRMLPEAVWSLPPMGTFNLHGSLLPQYRGAAPINRAVMNGETVTGVATFLLKQEIDTGNILLRKEIPIGDKENAGDLHDRMMTVGADLVIETVNGLADHSIHAKSQAEFIRPGEVLHDAPKIFRDTCKIDWTQPGRKIYNHIRGLSPFPAAWSNLVNGEEIIPMKIFSSTFIPGATTAKPGTITGNFRVNVPDGIIAIEEIQGPGKKRMQTAEFLRGFRLDDNAHFE